MFDSVVNEGLHCDNSSYVGSDFSCKKLIKDRDISDHSDNTLYSHLSSTVICVLALRNLSISQYCACNLLIIYSMFHMTKGKQGTFLISHPPGTFQ